MKLRIFPMQDNSITFISPFVTFLVILPSKMLAFGQLEWSIPNLLTVPSSLTFEPTSLNMSDFSKEQISHSLKSNSIIYRDEILIRFLSWLNPAYRLLWPMVLFLLIAIFFSKLMLYKLKFVKGKPGRVVVVFEKARFNEVRCFLHQLIAQMKEKQKLSNDTEEAEKKK